MLILFHDRNDRTVALTKEMKQWTYKKLTARWNRISCQSITEHNESRPIYTNEGSLSLKLQGHSFRKDQVGFFFWNLHAVQAFASWIHLLHNSITYYSMNAAFIFFCWYLHWETCWFHCFLYNRWKDIIKYQRSPSRLFEIQIRLHTLHPYHTRP